MTKKHKKVSLIKTITEYGLHIWAILIIANAALVYAFNFAAHADIGKNTFLASGKVEQQTQENSDPGNSISPTKDPKKKLGGPTLNLVFAVPGIGSGGGTLKPINLKRDVTVYLFSTDANSLNPNVKPLYTIKGKADFDTDTTSPTYTAFINKNFDLGPDIPEGDYQLAFRTNQSARTLVRESKDNLGGLKINLRQATKSQPIPLQSVNMGDVLPEEGDNVIDISDYNAFVNCYNDRKKSDFCRGRNYGDFDDNGIVDGIDYNIMLRSFGNLLEQGQSVPQLTVAPSRPDRVAIISSPTTVPEKEANSSPTKAVAQTQSSGGGGMIGGLLFFIFLIILAAIGFVLYKRNDKVRAMIRSVIHLSPTGKPGETATTTQQNQEQPPTEAPAAEGTEAAPIDQTQTPVTPETTPGETPLTESAATEQPLAPEQLLPQADQPLTEAPAPMPEAMPPTLPVQPDQNPAPPTPQPMQPITQPMPQPPVDVPPPAPAPIAPPPVAAAVTGQEVEKDVYVKVKEPDAAGTGQWVQLSDDNGPVRGHYAKNDAKDGFAKVKGVMKTENGETFMEVTELVAE